MGSDDTTDEFVAALKEIDDPLVQLLTGLMIQVLMSGTGEEFCIVLGKAKFWWPPAAKMTMQSGLLVPGSWAAVMPTKEVLEEAQRRDIDVPEEFGMPLSNGVLWSVYADAPAWRFELVEPHFNDDQTTTAGPTR